MTQETNHSGGTRAWAGLGCSLDPQGSALSPHPFLPPLPSTLWSPHLPLPDESGFVDKEPWSGHFRWFRGVSVASSLCSVSGQALQGVGGRGGGGTGSGPGHPEQVGGSHPRGLRSSPPGPEGRPTRQLQQLPGLSLQGGTGEPSPREVHSPPSACQQ